MPTTNELNEETKCYLCTGGISQAEALILALYRRWLLVENPDADTSLNGLLDYAKCYACQGLSLYQTLMIAMLDQIYGETVEAIVDSFVERSGITDLTQIAALTTLVTSARANGWWELSDVIYPFVGGTAVAHAVNLKSQDYTITWAGTVTHNANGITGNAVDGYGNMNYDPSVDGVQYQLNSAHITLYRRTNGADFMWYVGTAGGPDHSAMRHFNAGSIVANLNGGAFSHVGGSLGLVAGSRTGVSTDIAYAPNGSTAFANPSGSIPSLNMSILAITGVDGIPGNFSNVNLAFLTVGGGISAAEYATMEADIQDFQTSLGRQV